MKRKTEHGHFVTQFIRRRRSQRALWMAGACVVVFAMLSFFLSARETTSDARFRSRKRPVAVVDGRTMPPMDSEEDDPDLVVTAHDAARFAIPIKEGDRVHLNVLHAGCMKYNESIVPWNFGLSGDLYDRRTVINQDDVDVVRKLSECATIDIFHPAHLRGYGYCEDAVAYNKYLKARIMPMWAFDLVFYDPEHRRNVTYHELCPNTPLILFNHYWDGVHELPGFPKTKPLYLMPNIEMGEVNETHYRQVDVVLCKTEACFRRAKRWYQVQGNPRQTQVLYTKHTSLDIVTYAKHELTSTQKIKPKDYENIRFFHAAGGSTSKGTHQIIECWLSRPDFPPLDLYVHQWLYDWLYKDKYASKIAESQIRLETSKIPPLEFGKLMAEASFFLCPSRQEGYGHYLNEARAAGGVIVTTDVPPMNELVTAETGILVHAQRKTHPDQFLGGAFKTPLGLQNAKGLVAEFTPTDVCDAVDRLLTNTTVAQRIQMADAVQQRYHFDTNYFADRMEKLTAFARAGGIAAGARLQS